MNSEHVDTTVGLCGLGNMGGAIAGRLAALTRVIGYDPDNRRLDEAVDRHGIAGATELAEVAAADVVVLSLPSPETSVEVCHTLAPLMGTGALILETSTVNPTDMWRLRDLCAPRSVRVVDAAILSGVAQMEAGSATLLLGGDEADLARAAPILEVLGRRRIRFGDVGSGMAAKVINNAVAHAVMVMLAEAGAMAVASGVSGEQLAELLADPEAGLSRPLTHRFVERVLPGAYEGGMPTEAARKDSTLALALAQQQGVPLFAIQGAHTVYEIALAQGLGRDDYASVARLWEQWTGRTFTR
ncbi:MAG: NAD-binding protein [Streptosporangiales bacterium]|nr:NAD-binding protein [Streptosporangiales bacterium]